MKRKKFVILFDVLILAESGFSVLNDLQVAKQLVYSLQVNLSLLNDIIYVSCIFGLCIIFPY